MSPILIAIALWGATQSAAPPPPTEATPTGAAPTAPPQGAPAADPQAAVATSARRASAACTRATLQAGVPCLVEGESASAAPSRSRAEENRRHAARLADELCAAAARSGMDEADAAVLAACRARVLERTAACGGDGSRPLSDEAGRFNPGFARCYAGLAELAADAASDADTAASCCACAAACGQSRGQCLERASRGALGSCVVERCTSPCAAALLRAGPARDPRRAP